MAVNLLHKSLYYTFGMVMSERSYTSGGGYRFGFNGKEKDNESHKSSIAYDSRIFDSRLGRFLSVDPLASIKPDWSSYRGLLDNPILYVDPDGNTEYRYTIIINKITNEVLFKVETFNKVYGQVSNGGPWGAHTDWYDFATYTVTTIEPDPDSKTGIKETTTNENTVVLTSLGKKGSSYWILSGDGAIVAENKFHWLNASREHGRTYYFGLDVTGGDGEGVVAMDKAVRIIGSIDVDFIEGMAMRNSALSTYGKSKLSSEQRGEKSWLRPMTKASAKAWLELTRQNLKGGAKIGGLIEKLAGATDPSATQEISVVSEISVHLNNKGRIDKVTEIKQTVYIHVSQSVSEVQAKYRSAAIERFAKNHPKLGTDVKEQLNLTN